MDGPYIYIYIGDPWQLLLSGWQVIYLIAPFKPMSCILDLRIASQAYVYIFILVALRLEVSDQIWSHTLPTTCCFATWVKPSPSLLVVPNLEYIDWGNTTWASIGTREWRMKWKMNVEWNVGPSKLNRTEPLVVKLISYSTNKCQRGAELVVWIEGK